jgi:hypothetical protein
MKDYKEPNHEGNDNEEIKCHMLDHNFVTIKVIVTIKVAGLAPLNPKIHLHNLFYVDAQGKLDETISDFYIRSASAKTTGYSHIVSNRDGWESCVLC